jgi:hypothetical protein
MFKLLNHLYKIWKPNVEKRAEGYYWVKWGTNWTIGHYNPASYAKYGEYGWDIIASDESYSDSDFEEIGPFISPIISLGENPTL